MNPKVIESRFIGGPDDALAADDVYEVTDSAVRGRAAGVSAGLLSKLADTFKVPFEPLIEHVPEIETLIDDLIKDLMSRIKDALGGAGKELVDLISDGIMADLDDVGFATLGMFWEYTTEEFIFTDPKDANTLKAVQDVLKNNRINPNDPSGVDSRKVNKAIDQGAETFIYTTLVNKMLEANINAPVGEIIDSLSDDKVKKNVAERTFIKALNPKGVPGPDPTNPLINLSPTVPTNPSEGSLYSPVEDISPPFTTAPITTDITRSPSWASDSGGGDEMPSGLGEGVTSVNPNTPDWTIPPAKEYQSLFEDSKPTQSNVKKNRASVENIAGVRDNAPDWVEREMSNAKGFDFDTLETLLSYTSPNELIKRWPGIISMILHYYQLPEHEYDLEEEYTKLMNITTRIQEDWYYTERQGNEMGRLLHITNASLDTFHVLTTWKDSVLRDEVLIASSYRNNNLIELLKAQYPLAAI